MTSEQIKYAMECIDKLPNSTYWRQTKGRLRKLLKRAPQSFWEGFLEVTNPPSPEVMAAVRSGLVSEGTSLADVAKIIGAVTE